MEYLKQEKTAQVKLHNPASAGSSGRKEPIESPIKPEVAIPLYQAIGEEVHIRKNK